MSRSYSGKQGGRTLISTKLLGVRTLGSQLRRCEQASGLGVVTNAKEDRHQNQSGSLLILHSLSDFLAEMPQNDVHSYSSCLVCFVSVVANGDSDPDREIDQLLGGLGQEI